MQESLGNGSIEGLIAKAKPERRKRSKEKPKNLKCFLCHKEGILRRITQKGSLRKRIKMEMRLLQKMEDINILENVLPHTTKKMVNEF